MCKLKLSDNPWYTVNDYSHESYSAALYYLLLNPNKPELLSTRNLLRGGEPRPPPYYLWNHCGYDLEILQGGRTMKIVEQKNFLTPSVNPNFRGGVIYDNFEISHF